ncbi:MAG TPA: DUF6519 domain-containing protein [Thermoanaerobaculia bacterium]|jgi:hypothetical protein|nr:DUF6519 domain-containing protein [Thermoanaerobaculia bacterium]
MPGDYTRFTFKPRKNYAAVLRQQGRVGLDSDFNEMSDVNDRRWRSESMDIFGPAAVSDLLNPDAFLITPTAPGDFTIEPGRIYVDGLQAENHGLPPDVYDPALGEIRGTGPVPYGGQPYLPDPIPLDDASLPPLAGRSDLVYLDVWRRELTFIEDPEIREIALGGPDTASRLQTVWQVKVLAGVGDAQCGDDLAAWDDLIAPSAGRLTTATVAPPPGGDPCVITPEGGYRGLENRLYRVEIHDPGDGIGGANPARFKWSRDNASVASAVIGIDPGPPGQTRLRLRSLGRDRVLRFHRNDWIELLDDNLELAGQPGFMAQVADVDEADQALILDRTVTAGLFNELNPGARHTRVRRWDQQAGVDADGLLDVVAGPIDLEDGIQVTFTLDPVAGDFHVGDYWAFAARTANGLIEELAAAPPRGILHHYVRLAIVLWGPAGGAQTQDCRPHWPPGGGGGGEGCCTFVVQPGESIQDAIDALPDDGGCVCLKVGTHPIDAPIRILRPNVTLHGETPGARVVRANGVLMLVVANTETVTVADIRFEARIDFAVPSPGEFSLLEVIRSEGVSIHGCFATLNEPLEIVGIQIQSSREVEVQGCTVGNVLGGLLVLPDSGRIVVRENTFTGITFEQNQNVWGVFGIFLQDAGRTSLVERNLLQGFQSGVIVLRGDRSLIVENRIQRGTFVDPNPNDPRAFGIDAAAAGCEVRGNQVQLASPLHGGIRMADIEIRAEENVLESRREAASAGAGLPLGILLALSPAGGPLPDDGVIRANTFLGPQDAIRVEDNRGAQVLDNLIGVEDGLRIGNAITLQGAARAVVSGNRVTNAERGIGLAQGRQNRVAANTVRICGLGISADAETGLQVWDNRVEDTGAAGIFGINLLETADLSRNHLQFCGHELPDAAVGIGVFQSLADVIVELCEVLDTGLRPGSPEIGVPVAHGISLGFVASCRVQGNLVRYLTPDGLDLTREDRALLLVGPPSFLVGGDRQLAFGSALVQDNKFLGPGTSALVEMVRLRITDNVDTRFDRVTFSGNHCEHLVTQGGRTRATVVLWGEQLIAMGNHVRAIPDANYPSMRFNNRPNVALLGNVTTGALFQFASTVPVPHTNFNVLI